MSSGFPIFCVQLFKLKELFTCLHCVCFASHMTRFVSSHRLTSNAKLYRQSSVAAIQSET